jgi:type I restriction enzyme R subunit
LQERSIADGTVVRIHVDSRAVKYHLSEDVINTEYEKMVREYSLDTSQSEKIMDDIEKSLFSSPERIRGVCESIVDHYYDHIAPNGLKAQIVAANRDMCVAYDRAIKSILAERGSEDETAVVMSYNPSEDAAKGWAEYNLNSKQVNDVVKRFNSYDNPLKFLIVTSMLCTGFDAPIEGVMYLDKKLKKHTLFQTMSRVNRKWKHPETNWRKPYGMVVDYVGLGGNIAKAFAPVNPDETDTETIFGMDEAFGSFERIFHSCLSYFDEFPMDPDDWDSVVLASTLVSESSATLQEFVYRIGQASDLWEALYPDDRLDEYVDKFAWMVAVYRESLPKSVANKELLQRLGAKTLELIHANINDVTVERIIPKLAVLDAAAIAKLREQGILVTKKDSDEDPEDAEEVDITIVTNSALKKLKDLTITGDGGSPYLEIGDRLRAIYESYLEEVIDAAHLLHELLNMVGEIVEIEAVTLEFEETREVALPVILKNLMGELDGKSMSRLVKEIDGMATYFSGLSEEISPDDIQAEVVGTMERLGVQPENKMVAPILAEYVAEACRAAVLLR